MPRCCPTLALAISLAAGCASEPPRPQPVRARETPAAPPEPLPVAAELPTVQDCPTLEVELPRVADEHLSVPPLVDAHHLDAFFEKVARLLRGRAADHIRIAMYGDSNLTRDFVSGRMRRWLQSRYGDAGHGFVALIRPWGNYVHMDVRHRAEGGWQAYNSSTDPVFDQRVGIGGIAAESVFRGASTWLATAEEPAPVGQRASRLEVFFLKGRGYGDFDIEIDGQARVHVEARAERVELGVERVDLEDGPHEVRLVAGDPRRRTRLLGAVLERDAEGPSFVIDSLGCGGLNTLSQARQDPDINRAMLRERAYDLIIFATGANDPFTIREVPGALSRVVALQRDALPNVPILMLTPSDRGKMRTFPGTLEVVAQREAFAKEHGTTFWNLFAAMGGPNVMKSWRQRGFAREDYIHYTWEGGAYVADRLLHALWRELAAYLARRPRAGCEEPDTVAVDGADRTLPKGAAASGR